MVYNNISSFYMLYLRKMISWVWSRFKPKKLPSRMYGIRLYNVFYRKGSYRN